MQPSISRVPNPRRVGGWTVGPPRLLPFRERGPAVPRIVFEVPNDRQRARFRGQYTVLYGVGAQFAQGHGQAQRLREVSLTRGPSARPGWPLRRQAASAFPGRAHRGAPPMPLRQQVMGVREGQKPAFEPVQNFGRSSACLVVCAASDCTVASVFFTRRLSLSMSVSAGFPPACARICRSACSRRRPACRHSRTGAWGGMNRSGCRPGARRSPSTPLIGRCSLSATAMGHWSCGSGVPSALTGAM